MSANALDLSNAIRVKSIKDEYIYLRVHPCFCGGTWRPVSQSLVDGGDGNSYDVIGAQCLSCKREQHFVFDINSFFGKR